MISTEGAKILVVDDDATNRLLIARQLQDEGYRYEEASNGEEAILKCQGVAPDLILLDVMMPGMTGFEVAMRLKADPRTQSIPIIMITALDDQASRVRGLAQGAEDFISKPVRANELQIRVRNLLRLKLSGDTLKRHNQKLDQAVKERTRELSESLEEGILALMRAAEYRDDETGAHVHRISYYSKILAQALGADDDFCETIFMASPMHDIGKIGIPDRILLKPGSFTPDEWEVMKTHTTIGAEILSRSKSRFMAMGKEIAHSHHERWDGGGYPQGLKGKQIPLSARIMSICDVYDALRSKRPYKEAFDHVTAVKIIRYGDAKISADHFDPDVKAAFLTAANQFDAIFEKMND